MTASVHFAARSSSAALASDRSHSNRTSRDESVDAKNGETPKSNFHSILRQYGSLLQSGDDSTETDDAGTPMSGFNASVYSRYSAPSNDKEQDASAVPVRLIQQAAEILPPISSTDHLTARPDASRAPGDDPVKANGNGTPNLNLSGSRQYDDDPGTGEARTPRSGFHGVERSRYFAAKASSAQPVPSQSYATRAPIEDSSTAYDSDTASNSTDEAGMPKSGLHAVDESDSVPSHGQQTWDHSTVPVHAIDKTREIPPLTLSMSVTAQLPQDGITQGSTVTSSRAIAPDENPAPIAPVIRKDSNPEEAEEVSVSHPQLDSIVNTPPAPSGDIAFAARLTPAENTSNQDPSLSKARVQAAQSQAAEPISTQVSSNEKAIEQVSKQEAAIAVTPEFGQSQSAPPARAEAPPAIPTPTTHMEQAIEPAPVAASRVPGPTVARIPVNASDHLTARPDASRAPGDDPVKANGNGTPNLNPSGSRQYDDDPRTGEAGTPRSGFHGVEQSRYFAATASPAQPVPSQSYATRAPIEDSSTAYDSDTESNSTDEAGMPKSELHAVDESDSVPSDGRTERVGPFDGSGSRKSIKRARFRR